MPEPGLYGVLYNYFYTSDRLNDGDGNEITAVTINLGPGPGVTLRVDVDVDVYALAPTLIWVSPWTLFGAKYGAYIAPSFATTSVGASLATETGRGVNAETSQFAVGDLFVQPLWLGWTLTHWDVALGYGFYAPVGKYDTATRTLPRGTTVTAAAADNIGLGFWTHQGQGAVTWYPWAHKGTAVLTALTYEIHGNKEDFDLTPGQTLTWEWGISQFLPLRQDQTLLLEAGLAGYSSWQLTDDSGSDARTPNVHDQVHAVGGAAGSDLRAVGRRTERAVLWRVCGPGLVPGAGDRPQCGQEVLATPATRAQEEHIERIAYRGAPLSRTMLWAPRSA